MVGKHQIIQYAREAALELHVSRNSAFRNVPVKVSVVAKLLGFSLVKEAGTRGGALLKVIRSKSGERYQIIVDPDQPPTSGRFSIAHEIGHAVLRQTRLAEATFWPVRLREIFANSFAAELLVPSQFRPDLAERFRGMSSPKELTAICSKFEISPNTLFQVASSDTRFVSGTKKFWIRASARPNWKTAKEARLRIDSACYDRESYFLPSNQSIRSLCGSEDWIKGLSIGEEKRHETIIRISQKMAPPTTPRYRDVEVSVTAFCFRIREPRRKGPASPYLILLIPTDS